jgi:hypothetical protein
MTKLFRRPLEDMKKIVESYPDLPEDTSRYFIYSGHDT